MAAKLVPLSEASKALGLPERTLRFKLKRGEIKGRRDGRRWLVEVGQAEPAPPVKPRPSGDKASAPKASKPPEPARPGREAGKERSPETEEEADPDERWSYRSLVAFKALFPVAREALALLEEKADCCPEFVRREAQVRGMLALERLAAGYHAWRKPEKAGAYHAAREAAMAFSAALYLAGHLSDGKAEGLKLYAVKVERAGKKIAGLIRRIERNEGR